MGRFEHFIMAVNKAYKEGNGTVRYGQAIYNTLYSVWPDLAENIVGDIMLDPYYDDEKVNDCLVYLQGRFEGGLE